MGMAATSIIKTYGASKVVQPFESFACLGRPQHLRFRWRQV